MITPLRNQVLVELRETPVAPSGLVSVVRLERPPSVRAVVVACGDEVRDIELGDAVVISRLQGIEIAGGALLLPAEAVLATEPRHV